MSNLQFKYVFHSDFNKLQLKLMLIFFSNLCFNFVCVRTYLNNCNMMTSCLYLLKYLINHLFPFSVALDPVDQYLEDTAKTNVMLPSWWYPNNKRPNETNSRTNLYERAENCSSSSSSKDCHQRVPPTQEIASPASASALAASPFTTDDMVDTQKRPRKVTNRRKGGLGRSKRRKMGDEVDLVTTEMGDSEADDGEGDPVEIKKKVTCGK